MKTAEESFVNDKLPRWGQWVMVEAPSLRRLAFLDPGGAWRDARDGHVIEDVQSWSPTNADDCGKRRINTFGEQSRTLTTG
jgi:hypothetical protein